MPTPRFSCRLLPMAGSIRGQWDAFRLILKGPFGFSLLRTRKKSMRSPEIVGCWFLTRVPHEYVSLSGSARIVKDAEKLKELWSEAFRVWFPAGLDDPEL